MKSICFIVPYFTCGRSSIPAMTALWLESCKNNTTINWIVYTDCDFSLFDVPPNVIVKNTTFDEIRNRIQQLFEFHISLNSPYKLCDYKPVYGEAFQDELYDFDFWGFCDIDLIWGDMRKFLTEQVLDENDRILTRGHCSLFRNTHEINSGYRTLPSKGCMNWKSVFTSDKSWAFDEWAMHNGGGYSEIQRRNDIKLYDAPIFADIQINRYSLHTTFEKYENNGPSPHNTVFHIHCGTVDKLCTLPRGGVAKCEYLYVHFQQRKLVVAPNLDFSDYLIVPPNRAVGYNGQPLNESALNLLCKGNPLSWNVSGQIRRNISLLRKLLPR